MSTNAGKDGSAYAFVIDSTAPAVTVYELKPGGRYDAESKTVHFLVTDANIAKVVVKVDNVVVLEEDGEDLDPTEYDGYFTINESTAPQDVTITVTDASGNENTSLHYILNADTEGKIKENDVEGQTILKVTVSTNFYYAHPVLFWVLIAAAVVILGGVIYYVSRKKKESGK